MSEIPEAIGTAGLGAAAARAVEPKHGEQGAQALDRGHFAERDCLNCGTPLEGPFCKQCGQAAHLHRTLAAFFHDLAHGVLHLDGKVWRTLPLLALRPGRLTRDYIDGHRARYVSPMALFLFFVFLMFAVFQMVGLTAPTQIEGAAGAQSVVDRMRETAEADLAETRERLKGASPDDPARARLEIEQDRAEQALAGLEQADRYVVGAGNINLNATGIKTIDDGIVKKWRENPGLMIYKLQSNGYKFSWLLIPLSVPFVWLLFLWRRRFRAYDHSVFVTYSLSFMTLLFVVLSALGAAGVSGGWLFTAFATIAPLHLYKHLRGTYELSRFSATWRLVMLLFFISIIVLLFLQILLVLGAY